MRRLLGVSTSPVVGSIYNMGVWDKVAAAWVNVATRRTLDREDRDPGCQPSYEGLIPNSRSAKAASVAANVAKPAAQSAPTANVGAPIEAPTTASYFRDAMGEVQAAGTSATFEV